MVDRWSCRVVMLVVLLASVRSDAQSAGVEAEALFREGRRLFAEGKIAEACAAFEHSQQRDPAVSTLINLANCREKNNQLATAWGLFLEAERQTRAGTDDTAKALNETAKTRAAQLERRISKLTISVPQQSLIDGLEITRNANRVESIVWNRAMPIDGGTYTVTARAPGTTTWSTSVTVENQGDSKTVDIPTLHAVTEAEPAASFESLDDGVREGSSSKRMLPMVLGATALVIAGTAVGTELWSRSTYTDAKAEMVDQQRRDDLYDSANTKHLVAQGLAVAALCSGGVAVWLYVRGDKNPSASIAHGISISPTHVGVSGSF